MSRRRPGRAAEEVAVVSTGTERDREVVVAESKLRAALSTIETLWEEMLTPPARRPGQSVSGDGSILADDSESTADMPRVVTVVAARAEVARTLAGWCREVVREHSIEHGLPPSVHDGAKMAKFLTRWAHRIVEREDRDLVLDDVQTCASVVTRCAQPQRKDWMSLGPCPLEYEHPESGELERCPGEVRSYGDDAEGESWATCSACSTRAVASWWEEQMFGSARSGPLTTEQVITFVHRAYGRLIKRTTVQMWVSRGDLASCGKDDQGRRLYDPAAVAWAIDRQEKRRGGSGAR